MQMHHLRDYDTYQAKPYIILWHQCYYAILYRIISFILRIVFDVTSI